MAVTAGSWFTITLKLPTDAGWVVGGNYPTLPSKFFNGAATGGNMLVFCIDDSGPLTLMHEDGQLALVPAGAVNTDSAETTETTTLVDGTVWQSVRNASGAWVAYVDGTNAPPFKLTSPGSLSTFLS